MYEAEVNNSFEAIETIPADVRMRFAELKDQVVLRTALPWGEHCTECVWPVCYTTCELYAPRADGACRQFIGGAVRLDHKQGLNPYLIKVQFKQWAKLWTVGTLFLQPLASANRKESFNIALGAIGRAAPLPDPLKQRVLRKISYWRRRSAEFAPPPAELPDSFLMECFNPGKEKVDLTFCIRLRDDKQSRPFQTRLTLAPGYNCLRVPFSDIRAAVDLEKGFEVEIVPNGPENLVLYFGLMDFVKEKARPSAAGKQVAEPPVKPLKCVVWDLDNTLWDGILVEDGPENVRLKLGVVDVIRELDERGILHSIASKNNADDALKALRARGLEEYFLFPQIHWQPKSQSIAQIAQSLNIGIDSIAFVDDQRFEREEVGAALPQVTLIDALDCKSIPERPDCRLPVTAESRARRAMYREQERRQEALESYNGDYMAFLKGCQMEIHIMALDESNRQRVYELAQRTNQLNFSGSRYRQEQLEEIMKSEFLETFVIEAADRFGRYGIVGFGLVDTRQPRLLDLMFSCRVQSKRVEHAFLAFLLRRFRDVSRRNFFANYRKTPKNAPGGKVFEEVGFEPVSESEGVTDLVFPAGREIPDDQIVHISFAENTTHAS